MYHVYNQKHERDPLGQHTLIYLFLLISLYFQPDVREQFHNYVIV